MSGMKIKWKNNHYMPYISYNKLWKSEFDNIVTKKYNKHDLKNNKLKFEIHVTYKNDEQKQQILKLIVMKTL